MKYCTSLCTVAHVHVCTYVYRFIHVLCIHFPQSFECTSGRLLSTDGLDLTGAYLLETLGLDTYIILVYNYKTTYYYVCVCMDVYVHVKCILQYVKLMFLYSVQIPALTPVSSSAPQFSLLDDPSHPTTTSPPPSSSSTGCIMSQEQTVQLWTQIQQVKC